MALIHIGFFSESLGMQVSCDVILPQRSEAAEAGRAPGQKMPVLWLLHGASDDHTIWQRRTSIERYAAPLGLAVVMPAAHLSSYANMAHGGRFYDYIAKELPQIMRGFFPFSEKREDNYIAGLSMGGSGCLKIGLANPQNYCAIGCLSAGAQNFRVQTPSAYTQRRMKLLYDGRDTSLTEEDAVHCANRILSENLPAPRVFHAWGTEDFVRESAEKTRDFFLSLPGNPFDYTHLERPGEHNWEFWDTYIQHFFAFLGLERQEGIVN